MKQQSLNTNTCREQMYNSGGGCNDFQLLTYEWAQTGLFKIDLIFSWKNLIHMLLLFQQLTTDTDLVIHNRVIFFS